MLVVQYKVNESLSPQPPIPHALSPRSSPLLPTQNPLYFLIMLPPIIRLRSFARKNLAFVQKKKNETPSFAYFLSR